MSLLEAIILGIVQGLTEFIPISSSGHLVIGQFLFGRESDHLFLEFINIGTMLALVVYFWKRIIGIVRDIFINRQYRLIRNITITAIPAGAIGFFLSDFIGSNAFFGSIVVVMITLFVVGVVMIILERLPKLSKMGNGTELTSGRSLVIGLVQVFALIPGVSRSGSTIIAGRLMGLNAKEAAEYSFLASLPIMFGVTIKTLFFDTDYLIANMSLMVIGNIAAFISGLIAVGFLMRYLSKHGLAIFGWYRVFLAAVIAVILLVQSLS